MIPTNSLKKSETSPFSLPAITKKSLTLSRETPNRSLYMTRIKAEIPQQNDYTARDSVSISCEQKLLKNMVREFNRQALNILEDFIKKPKAGKPPIIPLEHAKKVTDSEGMNKQKIIEQCEFEMQRLEERCECLKYAGREEIEAHITESRSVIEKSRVENKELARTNALNGLSIVRGQKFSQIKECQQEKLLVQTKREELLASISAVTEETTSLASKLIDLDRQIAESTASYLSALQCQEDSSKEEVVKKELLQKKKHCEAIRGQIDQSNSRNKQRYLTKLKELDELGTKAQQHQKGVLELELKLQEAQREFVRCETHLKKVRGKG